MFHCSSLFDVILFVFALSLACFYKPLISFFISSPHICVVLPLFFTVEFCFFSLCTKKWIILCFVDTVRHGWQKVSLLKIYFQPLVILSYGKLCKSVLISHSWYTQRFQGAQQMVILDKGKNNSGHPLAYMNINNQIYVRKYDINKKESGEYLQDRCIIAHLFWWLKLKNCTNTIRSLLVCIHLLVIFLKAFSVLICCILSLFHRK